jgi:hypothetical protein
MIFAMQELPGEFTTFDFIPGIPAPFNFGLAILLNQKMLTLAEKLQTAPPLLPMLIQVCHIDRRTNSGDVHYDSTSALCAYD